MTPIDVQYEHSRETLLTYEDARFNSLMSGVADYYYPLNDYSKWGSFIRAIAIELTRLEYDYSYDVVSIDPRYLTPPDIQRIFAAPLFINKSYPQANQSDVAYQKMLVALIKAYQEGATVQAISDIITAYTGQVVVVQELYKLIGNGIYDVSDGNTLSVSVSTNTTNPLDALASLSEIQTVAQNLYAALDLGKPAHVGINYAVVFGTAENLDSIIMGILDTLSIVLYETEPAPIPVVFTFSPDLDPASPVTQIAAFGQLAGSYFTPTISAEVYAGLLSDAYREEYTMNSDGTYTLNPDCASDILLVDADNDLTGEVSKAKGVLAPQLDVAWMVRGDAMSIIELD